MTPAGRSILPRLSLTHIADAIENELSCLDENYKKPFIASIMAQIHSIFNKISRKSKKINETRDGWSNHDDSSQDLIDQVQNAESALVETHPAILLRNNIYDKAEETSSSIDVYWCERGLGLSDLGQFENALESYKRALEINPRSFKALKNRGNVFFRIGRYEEAIDDFRKALEINPQLIGAWYGMGNAMSKLGRYKEGV